MMTTMPMNMNASVIPNASSRNDMIGECVELGKYKDGVCNYMELLIRGVVEGLSDEYKFDVNEALTKLGLGLGIKGRRGRKIPGEVKEKGKKEKVRVCGNTEKVNGVGVEKEKGKEYPIPYEGLVKAECCDSLKCNGGLYTQCMELKVGGGRYCVGCDRHMLKKGLTVPEAGTVEDRQRQDVYNYVSPGGKRQVSFVVWLKTHNVSRSEWESYALERGIEISLRHFEEPVALKRGRPPSSMKKEVDGEKKRGRGRPRKTPAMELSTTTDVWSAIEMSEVPVAIDTASSISDVVSNPVLVSEPTELSNISNTPQEYTDTSKLEENKEKSEVRMKKKVCSKSKESYYVNVNTNEVYKYDKTSAKKGELGAVLGMWDESSKSVCLCDSKSEVESLDELSDGSESEYE
jgi:hypothetical protein